MKLARFASSCELPAPVIDSLLTGERRLCGTGRFVFVAIGPDERPVAVPQIPAAPSR